MSITRKNLFGKLNEELFRSIESATTLCKLRGNPYVELAHWLNQLWHQNTETDLRKIAHHFTVNVNDLERGFERALSQLPAGATSIADFSYHIELAIERAWIYASLECAAIRIRSGHLLMAMLTTIELRRALTAIAPELSAIPIDILSQDLTFITQSSQEAQAALLDDEQRDNSAIPGEASQAIKTASSGSLEQYSTDLTALAREGKIDPVLGRDSEITGMIDILLRRRQNNPLLTGEAGVGKTAIVEGLALAIAAGKVPPALSQVRLLTLDVVALSAGASMKGEFESRLKAVIDEAVRSTVPVILFIDEVHTLVGAGGAAGTGDAANLLKPALARGQLRTIGATTWSEFKRHIEKDPALTRRFQVLQVGEPSEENAIAMLRGLVPMLEQHHGVWIMDEAVQAAVRFSHRYIPARQLPDKAISLLDTACARVAVAQHALPISLQLMKHREQSAHAEMSLIEKAVIFGKDDEARSTTLRQIIAQESQNVHALEKRWEKEKSLVGELLETRNALQQQAAMADNENESINFGQKLAEIEAHLQAVRHEQTLIPSEVDTGVIASIVSDWTGIPVGQMVKDEARSIIELPERLKARVVGQPHALAQISESILTSRAGLSDPNKPIGVFMLVGPSGIGKTETALAIAENLYGSERHLITINMSEYQESHSVSSLKGAPPGYVGYGEGGVLTEAVRRKPYSVILLDEIEKAHPDIHELFFQVFDKGWMEDGEGRYIDFKNTVILLTSNVGSELINQLYSDPDTMPEADGILHALQQELIKVFPAAFLGRIKVIPYVPLAPSSLQNIVRMHLKRLAERMRLQHQIEFDYTDAIVEWIVNQCPVIETGARALIHFVEKNVVPELSRRILSSSEKICRINLDIEPQPQGTYSIKIKEELTDSKD